MTYAKGMQTPMITYPPLSKHQGSGSIDGQLYRSIVGALQYVTITRPDIAFSVNKVRQYMQTPLDTHWKAVKRILRYSSGILYYGLDLIRSLDLNITGFSNSNWASDSDDRRFTSEHCVYIRQ